jgi:hypothetical protein
MSHGYVRMFIGGGRKTLDSRPLLGWRSAILTVFLGPEAEFLGWATQMSQGGVVGK